MVLWKTSLIEQPLFHFGEITNQIERLKEICVGKVQFLKAVVWFYISFQFFVFWDLRSCLFCFHKLSRLNLKVTAHLMQTKRKQSCQENCTFLEEGSQGMTWIVWEGLSATANIHQDIGWRPYYRKEDSAERQRLPAILGNYIG